MLSMWKGNPHTFIFYGITLHLLTPTPPHPPDSLAITPLRAQLHVAGRQLTVVYTFHSYTLSL